MEKINAEVKKWGNSLGVVIPKKIVERGKIKEGIRISLIIESENVSTVGDVLNISKNKNQKKVNFKKILSEIDKEFD